MRRKLRIFLHEPERSLNTQVAEKGFTVMWQWKIGHFSGQIPEHSNNIPECSVCQNFPISTKIWSENEKWL